MRLVSIGTAAAWNTTLQTTQQAKPRPRWRQTGYLSVPRSLQGLMGWHRVRVLRLLCLHVFEIIQITWQKSVVFVEPAQVAEGGGDVAAAVGFTGGLLKAGAALLVGGDFPCILSIKIQQARVDFAAPQQQADVAGVVLRCRFMQRVVAQLLDGGGYINRLPWLPSALQGRGRGRHSTATGAEKSCALAWRHDDSRRGRCQGKEGGCWRGARSVAVSALTLRGRRC